MRIADFINNVHPYGFSTEHLKGHFLSDNYQKKIIETRKLERKSKQQISRLNDLLYGLNDII